MQKPLVLEIPFRDPFALFQVLHHKASPIFLDSARMQGDLSRYSFIAVEPFSVIEIKNNRVDCDGESFDVNPFDFLQQTLAKFSLQTLADLPPLQGGAIGYFAYDLVFSLENINRPVSDDDHYPDLLVGLYDVVFAFDHQLNRAFIFSTGFPHQDAADQQLHAQQRLAIAQSWLMESGVLENANPLIAAEKITSNFSLDEYIAAVEQTKNYIFAGDIFEANLSQRFSCTLPENFSLTTLYGDLRKNNPAPFSAYLSLNDVTLCSASPERFILCRDKKIETRPIKGTRPRSANEREDQALAHELLASEKDRAENIMIVDLMRNDLSRVCVDDSIEVTQLCGLETYATVHHLVSVIRATLREDHNALSLLRASFPGGSITGAPKIRAMEIIYELEPQQRGPYCGCLGYIGFDGAMDTSILIRTFAIKNKKLFFQAGGAIVADSDASAEYQETLTKAQALHKTLTGQTL